MKINQHSFRRGTTPPFSNLYRYAHLLAALSLTTYAAVPSAHAQSTWKPTSVFIQAGHGGTTTATTLGAAWDTPYRWFDGALALYGEASVSEWSYPGNPGNGYADLTQFALTPVFRYRGDGGHSAWFTEAAVGLSVTDRLYERGNKHFSTRWNFEDHLGVGRNFGARNEHEISFRIQHYSNGGFKEPNPGQTFVQLRYAYRFD